MAYDRDSFLAGLAVGRTLWRPHRDYGEPHVLKIQCFPCNQPIVLEYDRTWPPTVVTHYVAYEIYDPQISTLPWPDNVFCLLRHDENDRAIWEIFTPSASVPSYTIGIANGGYETLGGELHSFGQGGYWWNEYSESLAARFRTTAGLVMDENDFDEEQIFSQIPHFVGTSQEVNSFLDTAQLVQIAGKYYLVGAS